MDKTLTVHSSNIISRYAYLIEQRIIDIKVKKEILDNDGRYGHYKVDLQQVATELRCDVECLDDLLKEMADGARSAFLGPELEKLRKLYVEDIIGGEEEAQDAAE